MEVKVSNVIRRPSEISVKWHKVDHKGKIHTELDGIVWLLHEEGDIRLSRDSRKILRRVAFLRAPTAVNKLKAEAPHGAKTVDDWSEEVPQPASITCHSNSLSSSETVTWPIPARRRHLPFTRIGWRAATGCFK
jgi:hypothetical protein